MEFYSASGFTASTRFIFKNTAGVLQIGGDAGSLPTTFISNNVETARFTASGNLSVGTTSDIARVGIKGSGSTSATTSLLVQNSAGSNALQVRDDRVIIMAGLPTSSSGLPTGALWNNLGILSVA
jgi:hypothetical protein